jgi:hypothetical protein
MAVYHSAPYALIVALRGQADEARALVEGHVAIADAAGIGPIFGGHRSVLGFVALSLGDAPACIQQLEPLSSMLTPEIAESGWLRFVADEIEARVAVGDVERARSSWSDSRNDGACCSIEPGHVPRLTAAVASCTRLVVRRQKPAPHSRRRLRSTNGCPSPSSSPAPSSLRVAPSGASSGDGPRARP